MATREKQTVALVTAKPRRSGNQHRFYYPNIKVRRTNPFMGLASVLCPRGLQTAWVIDTESEDSASTTLVSCHPSTSFRMRLAAREAQEAIYRRETNPFAPGCKGRSEKARCPQTHLHSQ